MNFLKNLRAHNELVKFTYSFFKKSYISKNINILGIETSCDDTGSAIVDNNGNLLGESLYSQLQLHIKFGGIIPPIAQSLHRENIEKVVQNTIENSKLKFNHIDAIAVTTRPGLPLSLLIGMKYGKYLCKIHNKPFIPIHHMEAHALTARMVNQNLEFPFLTLLISGGHALIALVQDCDKFLLLGKQLDDAPGEAFDKAARKLKLYNLQEFSSMSGGQVIEKIASQATDLDQFKFTIPLAHYRDCNFSFSGIKNVFHRFIVHQEKKFEIGPNQIIPDVHNLCAAFQLAIARHIAHRIQRAIEFIELKNLIPNQENKILVVSGGAACNNLIAKCLEIICLVKDYKLIRPPPKLCTDNGIMIAWNGIERWKVNRGIYSVQNLDQIDIQGKSPLGIDITNQVSEAQIKCDWIKLTDLYKR